MNLRENWRVILLVLFVLGSSIALFAPLVTGNNSGGMTGLQYGLELSGGTRIRAPLVGTTAENVNFTQDQLQHRTQERSAIATALNVSESDVRFRGPSHAVEVYSQNVSKDQFASALNQNGFNVTRDDVRRGVTQQTRKDVVAILSDKVNQAGLSGGNARLTTSGTGRHYVVVEVPNANRSEVLNLIQDRGKVEMVAHFPTNNGTYREVSLLTNNDFVSIGSAQASQRSGGYYVPVTLKDGAAQNYSSAMQKFGFTSPSGTNNCPTQTARNNPDNATGYCLYTVQDGKVVYAAQMSDGLAKEMNNGDFVKDPRFIITATNMSEAQQLAINLKAGALPTKLAIAQNGTTYYLQPSLAQEFKLFSLITGLIAWLAVSFVVFVRYGSPRVAIPMLGTAATEVFILLGFAATVGLALNLSHIAGFIAVIGTGVDDLVIIADEILQEGTVATGRVFQNRFRKAFWVIGGAAATTIIAMSPLTVLSLGDLTGFAIVTIVGVLVGVGVTRPAYGDILRHLMLNENEE
ncbi:MAG: preprotein translocase subunit SecD [Halorientalis sp.]